jgi:hypothetical protein
VYGSIGANMLRQMGRKSEIVRSRAVRLRGSWSSGWVAPGPTSATDTLQLSVNLMSGRRPERDHCRRGEPSNVQLNVKFWCPRGTSQSTTRLRPLTPERLHSHSITRGPETITSDRLIGRSPRLKPAARRRCRCFPTRWRLRQIPCDATDIENRLSDVRRPGQPPLRWRPRHPPDLLTPVMPAFSRWK